MSIESEYRERLVKAITALGDLAGENHAVNSSERDRLIAKREGVQLALSYWDSRNW